MAALENPRSCDGEAAETIVAIKGNHRKVPVPPYKALRLIDGVLQKPCRWCDKPILKADGTPDRRRNWHPDCAEAYLIRNRPPMLRLAVWKRDKGKCAACGREHGQEERIARAARAGYKPSDYALAQDPAWEADHVVPLIDGGAFDLENVQTLCAVPCHRDKTAEENRIRFTKPKPPAEPLPLLEAMA